MNSTLAPREDHDGTTFERHYRIAELAEFWGLGIIWRTRSFPGTPQSSIKARNLTREVSPFWGMWPVSSQAGGPPFLGRPFYAVCREGDCIRQRLAECRLRCKELQAEGRKTA